MSTHRTGSASHTALTADPYDILHRGFHWQVPARFNIAQACCSRWAQATPQAVAVRLHEDDGPGATLTYGA
ncbi:MAG: AMP-binding protein, partial [Burkholderiaceae bacterium]|nr:AMP-binding protein [Burkholderiaceae bacterium]